MKVGVVGVVGPACSEAAMGAAAVLARSNIPLISFAATADELGDRATYPTFFRTVYVARVEIVTVWREEGALAHWLLLFWQH